MKTIKEYQTHIDNFDKERDWDGFYPLELFANINEEIGEIWQKIAWENDDKKKELSLKYKNEIEGDIGDLLHLILKLANQLGVDAEKGLAYTISDYNERFPIEKIKGKTANKDLGYDGKEN